MIRQIFYIDDNCNLIWGWAKKTNMIFNCHVPPNLQNLQAISVIIPVSNFISPKIGVPDDGNMTPHSFLTPWNKWPDYEGIVRKGKETRWNVIQNKNTKTMIQN